MIAVWALCKHYISHGSSTTSCAMCITANCARRYLMCKIQHPLLGVTCLHVVSWSHATASQSAQYCFCQGVHVHLSYFSTAYTQQDITVCSTVFRFTISVTIWRYLLQSHKIVTQIFLMDTWNFHQDINQLKQKPLCPQYYHMSAAVYLSQIVLLLHRHTIVRFY